MSKYQSILGHFAAILNWVLWYNLHQNAFDIIYIVTFNILNYHIFSSKYNAVKQGIVYHHP